jgi:addiction module RelE/StbE family toxin
METSWRWRVLEDLEAARRHIAAVNPRAARRVVMTILAAVSRLPATPEIGRPGRVAGTRELVISRTPYVVAYSVVNDEIVILDVLNGAQERPGTF